MKHRYWVQYIVPLSCLIFTSLSFATSPIIWDHYATPDVMDQDLSIEEDFVMQEFSVLIQAMLVDVAVLCDDYDIHMRAYSYSPSFIILQPINGNSIEFDITKHSLHFKGDSRHHIFTIEKNFGNGDVIFTVANGNRLKISPQGS